MPARPNRDARLRRGALNPGNGRSELPVAATGQGCDDPGLFVGYPLLRDPAGGVAVGGRQLRRWRENQGDGMTGVAEILVPQCAVWLAVGWDVWFGLTVTP